ncbi:uncharacterized protein CCR75_008041 [Bremia lactucae]|uniref:Uncharacterized protein n=1 Tax=Bremia lactucae TaxID=4779 RepID=A0A976ILT7_BRELC|nr:hypothetical protein CCR75_008041 [Bremia lactucae]
MMNGYSNKYELKKLYQCLMWNQVLRRIVLAEEKQQSERRRQQLAQATNLVSSSSNAAAASSDITEEVSQLAEIGEQSVAALNFAASNAAFEPNKDEALIEEVYDDVDYLQKHLLSRQTSNWSCLEDTQQANCLALNASHTLMAVGEREGRVTIWDNTTIRVITRELDPTLIAVDSSIPVNSEDSFRAKRTSKPSKVGSIENDNVSIEGEEEEQTEVSASVKDDEEGEDDLHESKGTTRTEDEAEVSGSGTGLTLSDLQVAKAMLKVVSQCAWSCDSQWLFAGCEEKGTRHARLCVWNVAAATLVSIFKFQGVITALSAHPCNPELLLVSYWNSCPEVFNIVTGEKVGLVNMPLENTDVVPLTSQINSRHPVLASCARYGHSGKRIYCATSKSTLAIFDATTLECLDSFKLYVLIQFVDLCVNLREDAMLVTSSKGIHEFVMNPIDLKDESLTILEDHSIGLREVALHSTGAVRAPWAICCFSETEEFVVGTPVVRHRHVGENGLFTWHRAGVGNKTTAQHNVGVKDGVLALAWDRSRHSVLAVSTSGTLHVLEEHFSTTWPGAMYPPGFRLITDNELHLQVYDADAQERQREKDKLTEAAKAAPVDVFCVLNPIEEFKKESDIVDAAFVANEGDKPCYISAIPITYYHRRHFNQLNGLSYEDDKHYGLSQSVFKALKGGLEKQKKSNSYRSKSYVKKRRRR